MAVVLLKGLFGTFLKIAVIRICIYESLVHISSLGCCGCISKVGETVCPTGINFIVIKTAHVSSLGCCGCISKVRETVVQLG